MFGKFGDFASLLKQAPEIMRQAQEMQSRAAAMQERLKEVRVEGTAGGGMVTVEANGQQQILAVRIDPAVFEGADRELLEDLVLGAVNQALDKARSAAAEEMQSLAGDMDNPAIKDMMAKLGLNPGGPGAAE
jgi:DNA-binding YbaB/EbfC family protein